MRLIVVVDDDVTQDELLKQLFPAGEGKSGGRGRRYEESPVSAQKVKILSKAKTAKRPSKTISSASAQQIECRSGMLRKIHGGSRKRSVSSDDDDEDEYDDDNKPSSTGGTQSNHLQDKGRTDLQPKAKRRRKKSFCEILKEKLKRNMKEHSISECSSSSGQDAEGSSVVPSKDRLAPGIPSDSIECLDCGCGSDERSSCGGKRKRTSVDTVSQHREKKQRQKKSFCETLNEKLKRNLIEKVTPKNEGNCASEYVTFSENEGSKNEDLVHQIRTKSKDASDIHNSRDIFCDKSAGFPMDSQSCTSSTYDSDVTESRRSPNSDWTDNSTDSTSLGLVKLFNPTEEVTVGKEDSPVRFPDSCTSPALDSIVPHIPDSMYVALDCEMVGTGPKGKKSVLARCSIVDYNGCIMYDHYIRPEVEITDYRTPWSGIRPSHMKTAVPMHVALRDIRNCLAHKVIVGHAVYHDFKVLGFGPHHYFVRDTAQCKRLVEMAGLEGKGNSLKKLSAALLERNIQGSRNGHCSVEDARATLDLFKLVHRTWEPGLYEKWGKKDTGLRETIASFIEEGRKYGHAGSAEDFLHDKFWPSHIVE